MHAKDAVLNQRGQGQPVEERIEARPGVHPSLVAQPLHTFQPEPEQGINVRSLQSIKKNAVMPKTNSRNTGQAFKN
jgi:hypothetical protein